MTLQRSLPVGVEGRPASTSWEGFQWSYVGCPCCGRVIPDSRSDDIGECELCRVQKILLDGPPPTWHEMVDARTPAMIKHGDPPKWRSRWQVEWENRPEGQLCRHERAAA